MDRRRTRAAPEGRQKDGNEMVDGIPRARVTTSSTRVQTRVQRK